MICRRCLRRVATRNGGAVPTLSPRAFSQSARASTSSAAQPSTTPLTPSPPSDQKLHRPTTSKPSKQPTKIVSSVPAGTVLKGLNFMKGKQDPIALEDDEYPAWLWTALDKKADASGSPGADAQGDLFSKSKKQRRIAAKALRKQQLLDPESLAPKIPIYEQSVDLPRGDGTVQGNMQASEARQELSKAMRQQRRSKIKEDNFLRVVR